MNSDKLDSIVENMITSIQLLKDEIIGKNNEIVQLEEELAIKEDELDDAFEIINENQNELVRLNDIIKAMEE